MPNLWSEEGQSEGGSVGNHHFVRNPSILVKASKRRTNSEKIPRSSHSHFRSLALREDCSTLISYHFRSIARRSSFIILQVQSVQAQIVFINVSICVLVSWLVLVCCLSVGCSSICWFDTRGGRQEEN